MTIATKPVRDERTIATENASYRWAYQFLSFGLLLIIVYRSFALKDSSWDLMLLVVLGGGVSASYQGAHRVLSWRWVVVSGVATFLAAALAAAIVVLRR